MDEPPNALRHPPSPTGSSALSLRRIPATALAAAAALAPLAAQGSGLGYGQLFELPTLSDECDHATVAVNAARDLLVCWQSVVYLPNPVPGEPDLRARQIEIAYFPWLEQRGRWGTPVLGGPGHAIAGDPAVDFFGSGADSCRKPDVLALGDGSFVVLWARTEAAVPVSSRLEAVRVTPSGVSDFVLDAPAPGLGYEIDTDLRSGEAGAMVDGTGFPGSDLRAAAVYGADEVLQGTEREYSLRLALMDWATLPPAVQVETAFSGIPWDESPGFGTPPGGLVLADTVADDYGHLVVAWGQYDHDPQAGTWTGSIEIRRLQLDWSWQTPALLLDQAAFGAAAPGNFLARPNLAVSHQDDRMGGNRVTLAWFESADAVNADRDLHLAEVDFTGEALPGAVGLTEHPWPNSPIRDDHYPVPVRGFQIEGTFFIQESVGNHEDLAAYSPDPPVFYKLVDPGNPWRPHADLWEDGSGQPGSRAIPVVLEGVGTLGTAIFLVIFQT